MENKNEINIEHWRNEITVNSWQELSRKFFHMSNMSQSVYRGVCDSERKLIPSIFQTYEENSADDKEKRKEILDACIRHFRTAIIGRRGTNPTNLNLRELLALGRHYGLPTPLLDWTYSPYVALFFAYSQRNHPDGNKNKYRAVYCLHKKKIDDYFAQKGVAYKEPYTADEIDISEFYSLEFLEPIVDENLRLINQNGLFTLFRFYSDLECWLKEHYINIESKSREKNKKRSKWLLFKIRIPYESEELRWEAVHKILNRMNINHKTLFPDLEGAALYTKMQISIPHY